MDAYKTVPRVSENYSAVNQTFYINGTGIFTYDNTQEYRIGYESNDSHTIRIAMYKEGTGGKYPMNFVIYSPVSIDNIDIRVISPYMTAIEMITSISARNIYGGGYYTVFQFTRDYVTYALNPYSTLEQCLRVMEYESPSEDSGVVVIANASPLDIPVSSDGVIVNAIARLLDPNDQGGTSIPGGGTGTFDDTSDPVPVPALPDISAAQSGLVALFRPNMTDLRALGSYLWTNLTDFIENLNKLFMNPMDYLIALNIFPCKPEVGERVNINIGSVTTTIDMPPILNQWYEFDCGVVNINEYWGSALDYFPNTKIQLMLPFIGSVQLNTDEFMGHVLGVRYRIDLLSGQCVALVTKDSDVYYQFTGECAVSVPLTGADWSRVYSAVVGAVGTAIAGGVGVAAAGAVGGGGGLVAARSYEAAAAGGASWASINATSKGIKGVAEMRQQMLDVTKSAMDNARNAASQSTRRSEGVRNMRLANTINNTVGQVMGAKAAISHSGTISGAAGFLGVRTPYLILEYPNQSLADNYKHFVGYPSNMFAVLKDLHGYTECEQVLPNGIWGTDDELAEILDILKGGVYL